MTLLLFLVVVLFIWFLTSEPDEFMEFIDFVVVQFNKLKDYILNRWIK